MLRVVFFPYYLQVHEVDTLSCMSVVFTAAHVLFHVTVVQPPLQAPCGCAYPCSSSVQFCVPKVCKDSQQRHSVGGATADPIVKSYKPLVPLLNFTLLVLAGLVAVPHVLGCHPDRRFICSTLGCVLRQCRTGLWSVCWQYLSGTEVCLQVSQCRLG